MELTQQQTRRVHVAIEECNRYIVKMEKLNFAWLSDEEKKTLSHYKQQKIKLQEMIA